MNKKFLSLFSLIALLASCSENEVFETVNNIGQGDISQNELCDMTFAASMSSEQPDDMTRAIVGEKVDAERPILWEEGDELSIFSSKAMTTNAQFTLNGGAGSQNATFSGSCAKGTRYFAVYPYNTKHQYMQSQGNVNIYWGGAQQQVREGTFAKNTPMVCSASATGQDSPQLNFKNVCSYLSLTIDYRCQSIVLKSNNEESLAAEKIMLDMTGEAPAINIKSTTSQSITVTSESGEPLQPGTYYIAVMPVTLNKGFTLTFTSVGGDNVLSRKTDKQVILKRSGILNLGAISIMNKMTALPGKGTEEDPYQIDSFEDLVRMSDNISIGRMSFSYFKQTEDIDCGVNRLTPIGSVTSNGINAFCGYYNGNNCSISNLKLGETGKTSLYTDGSSYECYVSALFAFVRNAKIYDLNLEFVEPSCKSAAYAEASNVSIILSPLIGVTLEDSHALHWVSDKTKIENISVKYSKLTYSWDDAYIDRIICGSMIGLTSSNVDISHCTTKFIRTDKPIGCETGNLTVGGIVGQVSSRRLNLGKSAIAADAHVHIDRCLNEWDMQFSIEPGCDSLRVGGILGYAGNDEMKANVYVTNCINNAEISVTTRASAYSTNEQIGGLVGYINTTGLDTETPQIDNCINNGTIKGVTNAGGIIGKGNDHVQLRRCANTGSISAPRRGSIVGYANIIDDTLQECEVDILLEDCINLNSNCSSLVYAEKPLVDYYGPNVNYSKNMSSEASCVSSMNMFKNSPICKLCKWEISNSSSKLRFTDESFYQTSNN